MTSSNHRSLKSDRLLKSRRNFDQYLDKFRELTSKVIELNESNLSISDLGERLKSTIDKGSYDELSEDFQDIEICDYPILNRPDYNLHEKLKSSLDKGGYEKVSEDFEFIEESTSNSFIEICDDPNLNKTDQNLCDNLKSKTDEGCYWEESGGLVEDERASIVSSSSGSWDSVANQADSESESVFSRNFRPKSRKLKEQQQRQELSPSNVVYFKVDIPAKFKKQAMRYEVVQKDSFFEPKAQSREEDFREVPSKVNEQVPTVDPAPLKFNKYSHPKMEQKCFKFEDNKVLLETSGDSIAVAPNSSSSMTSTKEDCRNSRLQAFLSDKYRVWPRDSPKRPQNRDTFPSNVIYLNLGVKPKPKKKVAPAFDVVQKGNFFEVVPRPKLLSGNKSAGRRKTVWY